MFSSLVKIYIPISNLITVSTLLWQIIGYCIRIIQGELRLLAYNYILIADQIYLHLGNTKLLNYSVEFNIACLLGLLNSVKL